MANKDQVAKLKQWNITLAGKKEYELQKLREKVAPFLNQEEK